MRERVRDRPRRPDWMPPQPRQRVRETHVDRVDGLTLPAVLNAVEREPTLLQVRQRLVVPSLRVAESLLQDLGLRAGSGWHPDLDERIAAYRRRYDE